MRKHWLLAGGWYAAVTAGLMFGAWQGKGQLMLLDMPTANHKLILAMSLVVAGGTLYGLARAVGAKVWPALLGGTLYLLNPYTIDRLWSGQWRVLAGYAVMPLLWWLAIQAWRRGGRWWWLLLGAYSALPVISQHWWLISTLLGGPILLVMARGKRLWGTLATLAIVDAIWYRWLSSSPAVGSLQAADSTNFGAVPTLPGGLTGTVLGLGGFWYHPFDFWPGLDALWLGFIGLMLFLSTRGWYEVWRQHRPLAMVTGGIWLLTVLVVWLSGWPPAQSPIEAIMNGVPGLVALREMTKLSGLIALGYAIWAPLGWRGSKHGRLWAMGSLVALSVAMAPAYGGGGYIANYQYPAGWAEAKAYLDTVPGRRVVVLPYTGYMVAPWAGGRLVGNQAPSYFGPDVMIGSSTGNPTYNQRRGLDAPLSVAGLQDLQPTHLLVLQTDHATLSDQELQEAGWHIVVNNADVTIWTK